MINEKTFQRYATNPAAFRADLLVDVDGYVRRFGDIVEPWQKADFAAIDPGLMRCNGRSKAKDVKMRAYLERARGHSKTTDLAVTVCYALAFATNPVRGYGFAADRDQAGLLKDAVATIVRLNPWLGEILDVQKNLVLNKATGHPGAGGKLEIFTSDVASSYGILPTLIICDEFTHWEGDGSLWHSIISSAAKRSNCLLVTISNAGFMETWQWAVREAARTDPGWHFSRLDGVQASWMTPERLAEQARMLPRIAYERLWENRWSPCGGDALTEEDINAAFDANLKPMPRKQPGYRYVAGMDLGVSRDASAVVVLGIRQSHGDEADYSAHGHIRLVATRRWKPTAKSKVNLQEVEDELQRLHAIYDLRLTAYDPWECRHIAQRLALSGMEMLEVTPTGSSLQKVATSVIEAFADRRLALYEEPDLRRELRQLRVEERNYGFRLVSPRDEHGHGDTASAFGNAVLAATEVAGTPVLSIGAVATNGYETFAEARSAFEQVQARYQREMRMLSVPDADDTELSNDTVFLFGDS